MSVIVFLNFKYNAKDCVLFTSPSCRITYKLYAYIEASQSFQWLRSIPPYWCTQNCLTTSVVDASQEDWPLPTKTPMLLLLKNIGGFGFITKFHNHQITPMKLHECYLFSRKIVKFRYYSSCLPTLSPTVIFKFKCNMANIYICVQRSAASNFTNTKVPITQICHLLVFSILFIVLTLTALEQHTRKLSDMLWMTAYGWFLPIVGLGFVSEASRRKCHLSWERMSSQGKVSGGHSRYDPWYRRKNVQRYILGSYDEQFSVASV